tara:strand:- start:760 stop:1383 length:624 start_codon:yes stop_codon:yes gene_type:complete
MDLKEEDIGAGSGIFSKQLLEEGLSERAVCVDPNYDEEREEFHEGKSIQFVKSIPKTTQPIILMMDVLEHVPDDLALLKEYVDTMDKGGHVFITVPAFQFMWSGHDVFLEHYRRYTIEMVESVVKKAGLTPVKSRYFFGSLFPAVFAIRLVKKLLLKGGAIEAKSETKLYPSLINKALTIIHDVERWFILGQNKYFGLSVFCLCRKN